METKKTTIGNKEMISRAAQASNEAQRELVERADSSEMEKNDTNHAERDQNTSEMREVKNMSQLNAHQFEEVYEWLGINLDDLGCVMLDLGSIKNEFPALPLHFTNDSKRFWINGWVADKTSHITLLYGLLEKGHNYEKHIERVLDGWKLTEVEIADIGFFKSPYADEDYYCIVAHIKATPELLEGHQRLEFLPHINTFTGYKPHLTLCYIEPDEKVRDDVINELKSKLTGQKIKVKSLNLGDRD